MRTKLIFLVLIAMLFLQSNSCDSFPPDISEERSSEYIWWNELNDTWQELFLRQTNHLGSKANQEIIEEVLVLEKFSADHYPLGETGLDPLKILVNLKDVSAGSTYISQIEAVQYLPNLEFLNLAATSVSDLSPLRKNKKLISLYVQQTLITDISPLEFLLNLEVLHIDQTEIRSIKPIMKHDKLSILSVGSSPIPPEEIQRFRELHPKCQILN
ncbi:MAG: hypothetical protein GQ527_05545 [Bacteroidales bacterium]|nr:hypothetical protein [Bacteroidales bacterium]